MLYSIVFPGQKILCQRLFTERKHRETDRAHYHSLDVTLAQKTARLNDVTSNDSLGEKSRTLATKEMVELRKNSVTLV